MARSACASCAPTSTWSRATATSGPEGRLLLRVGILGGTFNPPHIGHLVCAQEAGWQLGLERVMLMPAGRPPHKEVEADPGVAHRLGLCRAAVQAAERLEVCDLETRRAGPSYTVDTLQVLRDAIPDRDLVLILGGDAAAGLPAWREPERLLSLATLAVAQRRGTSRETVQEALAGLDGGERTVFFDMPEIAISSTMLRRRFAGGGPTRFLTPDSVREYVAAHQLYASEAAE